MDIIIDTDEEGQEDINETTYADGWCDADIKEQADKLLLEIRQVESDSQEKRNIEKKWRTQADATPNSPIKNYPMPNSANVTPPLAMIHSNTMGAEIMNYFSVDPFWSFKAFGDDDAERNEDAKLLTKYFSILARSDSDLGLKNKLRTIAFETALIGRTPLKVPYYFNVYRVKGDLGESRDIVIHDGPSIDCLEQKDCFYPEGWESFEEMPWVATKFVVSKHELSAKRARGEWENLDKLLGDAENMEEGQNFVLDKDSGKVAVKDAFEFYEVCFYYDVDKDGFFEDHVWVMDAEGVVYSRGRNTLGVRPYAIGFYNKKPYKLEGVGTGKICEMPQDEIETLHNLRLDNMKIVNMRMLEVTRATAMANDEDIYPGKLWVSEKIGSIGEVRLGEVYPSTLQEEQNIWHTTAQATSMSEVKRGFSDPTLGQRDTFRGQQMRLNQSRGIFGTIVDGLTECFNRLGLLIFAQLRANKDRVVAREQELGRLNAKEIARLTAMLSNPNYALPGAFPFQIVTGAVEAQQGAELQAVQMATQVYAQWAMQSAPLAQQVLGPQAAQMMQQAPDVYRHMASVYVGSTKLLERTLKLVGITDYNLFTPDVSKLSYLVELMDKQQEEQVKMLEEQSGIQRKQAGDFGGSGQVAGGQPPVAQGDANGLSGAPGALEGTGLEGAMPQAMPGA